MHAYTSLQNKWLSQQVMVWQRLDFHRAQVTMQCVMRRLCRLNSGIRMHPRTFRTRSCQDSLAES